MNKDFKHQFSIPNKMIALAQNHEESQMSNPRPFYLIAHNPNTVDKATACLAAGANALEPDVFYTDNNFYVMGMVPLWSKIFPRKKGPLLTDYLNELQTKIFTSQTTNPPLQLALLLFDTKNIDQYVIDKLLEVVRDNFTLPQVRIGITTGNKNFIYRFKAFSPKSLNEIVGVDGGCSAADADSFFQRAKMDYTYASGTSVPLVATTSPKYFNEIRAAIQLRDSSNAYKPTMVYAWTVNSKESMRAYVRLGVDGLITDKIMDAVGVISEPEFIGKVEIDRYATVETI
jgi:hypothetical protein